MRKRVFGRKLKRTTNQRKSLFKSLAEALVLHGRIKTTEAKAKAVKGEIEKLVTHAIKNDANTLSYLKKHVHTPTAERLILISPVFKGRPGGYTRIIRLGGRKKDNAPMVILEFVEKIDVSVPSTKREAKTEVKKVVTSKAASVKIEKAEKKEVKAKPAKKSTKATK